MFTSHMSYADIIQALSIVEKEKRTLTPFEFKKICESVKEPFLRAMIQFYSIPPKLRKILDKALAETENQVIRNRNQRGDTNDPGQHQRFLEEHLNVHSVFYNDSRSKTSQYFDKTYPTKKSKTTEDKRKIAQQLSVFLEKYLNTKDVEEQLQIFEKERYKKRLSKLGWGKASSQQGLGSIKKNIREYITFLGHPDRLQMTYAWDLLDSIFIRLNSLNPSSKIHAESVLNLMRAIDDARTAYHDYPEEGKLYRPYDYTCPKGLQERLQDQHAHVIDMDFVGSEHQEVEQFYGAFVNNTVKEEGAQCVFSKRLYDLYIQAADYRKKVSKKTAISYLKSDVYVNLEAIKTKYLKDKSENLKDHKVVLNFLIATITRSKTPVDWEPIVRKNQHPAIVQQVLDFLIDYGRQEGKPVFEKVEIEYEETFRSRKDDEITQCLLENGPFIDLSHLRNALALHDPNASFDSMHSAFMNGGDEFDNPDDPNNDGDLLCTQESMRAHYEEYLRVHPNSFLFFRYLIKLQDLINNTIHQQDTVPCHQDFLCDFLLQNDYVAHIPKPNLNKLALLCVRAGYNLALELLIGLCDLDVNEKINGKSLLDEALENSDIECLSTLVENGACLEHSSLEIILNFDLDDRLFLAGLIEKGLVDPQKLLPNAIQKRNANLVSLLIEMGADPDLENDLKHNAYTYASLQSFKVLCAIVAGKKKYSSIALWLESFLPIKQSYVIRITAFEQLLKQLFFIISGFLINIPLQSVRLSIHALSMLVSFVCATYGKFINILSSIAHYSLGVLIRLREIKENILGMVKMANNEKTYYLIRRDPLFYLRGIFYEWSFFYPNHYRSFFDYFRFQLFNGFSSRYFFEMIAWIIRLAIMALTVPYLLIVKTVTMAITLAYSLLFLSASLCVNFMAIPIRLYCLAQAIGPERFYGHRDYWHRDYDYWHRKIVADYGSFFTTLCIEGFKNVYALYCIDLFTLYRGLGADHCDGYFITTLFSRSIKASLFILSHLIRLPLILLKSAFLLSFCIVSSFIGHFFQSLEALGIIQNHRYDDFYYNPYHTAPRFSIACFNKAYDSYRALFDNPSHMFSLYHALRVDLWDDYVAQRMTDRLFSNFSYPVTLLLDVIFILAMKVIKTMLLLQTIFYALGCSLSSRLFEGSSCFKNNDEHGSFFLQELYRSSFMFKTAYEKRIAPFALLSYQKAFLRYLNQKYQIDNWAIHGYALAAWMQKKLVSYCEKIVSTSECVFNRKNNQSFLKSFFSTQAFREPSKETCTTPLVEENLSKANTNAEEMIESGHKSLNSLCLHSMI